MFIFTTTLHNMSQEKFTQFIEDLLSKNILYCALCRSILQSPVFLVEDVGDVCGVCVESHEDGEKLTKIRNKNLELIIEKLTVPCKFEADGCRTMVQYLEREAHAKTCIFQNVKCLLRVKSGCEWSGPFVRYSQHFEDAHSDNVIQIVDNNKFVLEVNTRHAAAEIGMLKINSKKHGFLIIEKDQDERYLCHKIYLDSSSRSGVCLKYHGNGSKHKVKCNVLPLIDLFKENTSASTKISLQILTELQDESRDSVKLVIKTKSNLKLGKTEDFLFIFECPVCKSLMKPPIYLCAKGHSLCKECKSKLQDCPECRSELTDVRNYRFENFSEELFYPCLNQIHGCSEVFKISDLNSHESECDFQRYKCPHCAFEASYTDMKNHFTKDHSSLFASEEAELRFMIELYGSYPLVYQFIDPFNNIYQLNVSQSRGEITYFNLEILNSYSKKYKYLFQIEIVNDNDNGFPNLLTMRFLSHSVRFDLDELAHYANKNSNNELKCICRIQRVEHTQT